MFVRVVGTSGTSLLLGRNVGAQWLAERAADRVRTDRGLAPQGQPDEVLEELEQRWRRDPPPIADDKRVSAEYSVLRALRATGQLADRPQVVLVHSGTFDGELAARLVRALLERSFEAQVRLRRVGDLDVADRRRLAGALGDFMHVVAAELREGDPRSTVFAPLGGYKVMTSLGYLTGAYCGYSSVYLHEDAQALHVVPWVPVRIDEVEMRRLAPLARRARRTIPWSSLSAEEQATVDSHGWLFERADELVALNAFGEFLAREDAYRPLFRTRIRVADEAALREHLAAVRRDVAHLLDWLPYEHTDRRNELHHETAFGHHGTRFALYKHGGSAMRLAWRYDADEDVLYLRRIWPEHDDYEREARSGEVLRAEWSSWTDVTDAVLGDA